MIYIKKIFTIILAITIFAFSANYSFAQEANNKFGIHIIDESDLDDAAELVNSNGGEWGYVTVVIREDQRDEARWQQIFDKMRRLKLIPIVRIATKIDGGVWLKPDLAEANNWAAFLDNLLWPIKNRYVILYNEPNHAKEWGGEINPAEYARVVQEFEKAFRNHSDEFKILPAALDLAAPNSAETMEASRYWDIAHGEDNFLFTRFDVWNSHSYPNPGFSGEYTDTGKMSIQGYKWELEFLENYGLNPDIDVFITETGWIAAGEDSYEYISENYKQAFSQVWDDPQVKAVTPFLLRYTGEPFDKFAFINESGIKLPMFDSLTSIEKQKGEPAQDHSYKLESTTIAKRLVANSNYLFYLNLKNTGQSIWSKKDGFAIHFQSTLNPDQVSIGEIIHTEPNQTVSIPVKIDTASRGRHSLTMQLNKNGDQIGNLIQANFEIISPPSLEIRIKGWFGENDINNNYTLTLSEDDRQIMKIEDLLAVGDQISIPFVYNVIPGRKHRLKIAKNYHIPKTKNIIISANENYVNFGRLLPFDLNNDDKLSSLDFVSHIFNSIQIQKLISPL